MMLLNTGRTILTRHVQGPAEISQRLWSEHEEKGEGANACRRSVRGPEDAVGFNGDDLRPRKAPHAAFTYHAASWNYR